MKKYLIRIVGALCILGSLALMFIPAWFQVEGVKERQLKKLRSEVADITDSAGSLLAQAVDVDEKYEEDMEDNDLPTSRSKIKAKFKEIRKVTDSLLTTEISMQQLLEVSGKVPGAVNFMEDLMETDYCSTLVLREGAKVSILSEGMNLADFSEQDMKKATNQVRNQVDSALESGEALRSVCSGLQIALWLVIALAVLGAVFHVLNKGRWVKYLFMAVLIILVIGSAVATTALSDLVSDALSNLPALEDATLKMTVTPFLALGLVFVPIVLDSIFERKSKNY